VNRTLSSGIFERFPPLSRRSPACRRKIFGYTPAPLLRYGNFPITASVRPRVIIPSRALRGPPPSLYYINFLFRYNIIFLSFSPLPITNPDRPVTAIVHYTCIHKPIERNTRILYIGMHHRDSSPLMRKKPLATKYAVQHAVLRSNIKRNNDDIIICTVYINIVYARVGFCCVLSIISHP